MTRGGLLMLALAGCWGDNAYIVEGTVVDVRGEHELVIDHQPIKGLMGAMVMPFTTAPEVDVHAFRPGDQIVARLMLEDDGAVLDRIRVSGHVDLASAPQVIAPLAVGEVLERTELVSAGGAPLFIGEGQGAPTLVTFLYTRCPMPEFCPLTVQRLQQVQTRLPAGARIVAVTLDPANDTSAVLAAFAEQSGADAAKWQFGRAESEGLSRLASRAALQVSRRAAADGGAEVIEHGVRWWVLDAQGKLVERYDTQELPVDRLVSQLGVGVPGN